MSDVLQRDAIRRDLYGRVCDSYHGVDDFRMKLLGLLPVATGGGVFVLLSTHAEFIGERNIDTKLSFAAIGAFGVLFTLGLFSYELFGIKKCHHLIVAGKHLESDLHVRGQFRSRPEDLARFVNEPFASAVIYPGCLAAWIFLAVVFSSTLVATIAAAAVFVIGCILTLLGTRRIKLNERRATWVFEVVSDEGGIDLDELQRKAVESELMSGTDTRWVHAAVQLLHRQGDVKEEGNRVVCLTGLATEPSQSGAAAIERRPSDATS